MATAVGCGLSEATEGLFDEGGGGSASTGEPGSTTGTDVTTTTTKSSGGGGDPATTTTSSGGGEGGAATTTTNTTTTSAGGGGPTLDCDDGVTCPQGGENACCWYGVFGNSNGVCIQGPPSQETCDTTETQAGLHTRIECQDPSHCDAGQICCGDRESFGGGTYYVTVTCQSQCPWPDIHMCDPMNPVCPIITTQGGETIQTVCEASALLPAGFFVCGTP